MKITFKPLTYQLDAVQAVVDVFRGQQQLIGQTRYTLDRGIQPTPKRVTQQAGLDFGETDILQNSALQTYDMLDDENIGFANTPLFDLNEILKNIQTVQANRQLPKSTELVTADNKKGDSLTQSPLNLNIEMETGTGKTYTYLRTIFEMNKQYGWSKFIIVVPSIAIREGVNKSIAMMADDLLAEYGKKPRAFIYDSKNLHKLQEFSNDGGINIMIINVQAFNATGKDARKIYGQVKTKNGEPVLDKAGNPIMEGLDEFQSRIPINIIKRNNPIIILDEPQKMGADKTLQSLANFNPLFILRYSATHKRDYNLVYRLDALDAYNQKLVKKITVKGIEVKGLTGTNGYLYLQDVIVSNKAPVARLELEIKSTKGEFRREIRNVIKDDNLFVISKEAEQYKDRYTVTNIKADSIEFANGIVLHIGQGSSNKGDGDDKDLRRIQIRETIRSHLDIEQRLFHKGIKVLSLFFIDEVAKYRQYDSDGNAVNGEYADIFEQTYTEEVGKRIDLNLTDDPYQDYLKAITAQGTHNGYFSLDKNRHMIDPKTKLEKDEELGERVLVADDIDAYDLILKDKESLLAFPEPLDSDEQIARKNVRFIFSHSALREGWDNPNVFVICTLKHSDNVISRRQEVGRGLRLAVDRHGTRMDSGYLPLGEVHRLNNLTVITNESYAEFVDNLQKEMLENLATRPSKANPQYFTGKTLVSELGGQMTVDAGTANQIYKYLVKNNYLDDDDNLLAKFHDDKDNDQLPQLPEELQPFASAIHKLIGNVVNPDALKGMFNNGNKPKNTINPENLNRKEFQALWRRINQKSIYQIGLDSDKLIAESISEIDKVSRERNNNFVQSLTYTVKKSEQKDSLDYDTLRQGDSFGQVQSNREQYSVNVQTPIRYDLIGQVASRTNLTRRTVVAVLSKINSAVFSQFKHNPEAFISEVSRIINEQQAKLIVQNIVYELTQERYDSNDIFVSNIPLSDNATKANRHVWEYVETDSDVERKFLAELEQHVNEVIVYAKLPKNFVIPTPFGGYNPDWAIAFNQDKIRHVYFVAETKGSTSEIDLRESEKQKIASAKAFFAKLQQIQGNNSELEQADTLAEVEKMPVSYEVVDSFDSLMQIVGMK
ncbi:restriction endonuclease subunit R [Moraxella osloensis]|uniref:Restriction endonuclease subunit R n=1 Tax=Faucicola osloensis TaxID=34062 RepID=A0A2I1RHM7_FAUOS|nr:DEAD/DEAH box helicase family protein [Moraxella osloensis]PKZ68606.1 restriction endonuclease subunit R [Moraxella osloensis]